MIVIRSTNREKAGAVKSTRLASMIVAGIALFGLIGVGALIGLRYNLDHQQTASLGGPFQLKEADGRTVSDRDFRGKYMLIYFGYTSCPDICPTTMADLGIALRDLGAKANQVQPLFVTVDPKRDTPDVLKDYVSAFSPRLVGLTGSPQQIAAVEKEFHVYAKIERTSDGPNDYSVDHSSVFYLMGPDGHFITALRADQEGEYLAKALARYIA